MKNSFRRITGPSLLTAALATLFAANQAQAGNTWDGGGANGLWSNNLNWDLNTLPTSGAGNNLTFAGTAQLVTQNDQFAAGTNFNGINFNAGAGAFTLNGNSIALNGNVANNSTSTQTINLGLILTGGNKDVSTVAGGQVVISGIVSQDATGGRRLQATGLGTVTLNGTAANTYNGQTSASANGTLIVDLLNIAGNTNLVSTASQLNLGNGNSAAAGTFILKGAGTGSSSQTLNGFLLASGTAGLVQINANGGTSTTLNLGNGITRNGGSTVTFDISSTGAALTGTTLGLTAAAQTVNQGIRGYAFVKDAGGTGFAANVGGALVRYTGGTALLATGNLLVNNATLAAGNTTTTLTGSQSVNSLDITTTGGAGFLDIGTGNTLTLGQGAVLAQGSSTLTIQNGQLGANNTEVILHAIGTAGLTVSSNISSGTGSLTKSGSDAVTLSGSNTYSGSTAVIAGTLKAGSTTAFSANSLYNLANTGGVGLDLNGFDVTVGSLTGGGTLGGGIALGANTMTLGGKSTANDYNGIISGTGGVTKVGTATLQLFGASTYTGATTINDGVLRARNANAIGVNSALTLGSTGTLDIAGNNLSVGSLSGSGSVTNTAAGTSTLTAGINNASTTYSGVISNGTTPATMITAFTKVGTGELTFTGINTYTGNTNVNGGILTIDTAASLTFAIRNTGVNNAILGTGALNLNGAINFDLALAAASGVWNVINVGTLNEAYGANFQVTGFTENTPDVWTRDFNGSTYTFTQGTGVLTGALVPEPTACILLGTAVLGLVSRRRRSVG